MWLIVNKVNSYQKHFYSLFTHLYSLVSSMEFISDWQFLTSRRVQKTLLCPTEGDSALPTTFKEEEKKEVEEAVEENKFVEIKAKRVKREVFVEGESAGVISHLLCPTEDIAQPPISAQDVPLQRTPLWLIALPWASIPQYTGCCYTTWHNLLLCLLIQLRTLLHLLAPPLTSLCLPAPPHTSLCLLGPPQTSICIPALLRMWLLPFASMCT